jgi:hypothetical protein
MPKPKYNLNAEQTANALRVWAFIEVSEHFQQRSEEKRHLQLIIPGLLHFTSVNANSVGIR